MARQAPKRALDPILRLRIEIAGLADGARGYRGVRVRDLLPLKALTGCAHHCADASQDRAPESSPPNPCGASSPPNPFRRVRHRPRPCQSPAGRAGFPTRPNRHCFGPSILSRWMRNSREAGSATPRRQTADVETARDMIQRMDRMFVVAWRRIYGRFHVLSWS